MECMTSCPHQSYTEVGVGGGRRFQWPAPLIARILKIAGKEYQSSPFPFHLQAWQSKDAWMDLKTMVLCLPTLATDFRQFASNAEAEQISTVTFFKKKCLRTHNIKIHYPSIIFFYSKEISSWTPQSSLPQLFERNPSQPHVVPSRKNAWMLRSFCLGICIQYQETLTPSTWRLQCLYTLYLHAYTVTVVEVMRQAHMKDPTIPKIRRRTAVVQNTVKRKDSAVHLL